MTDATYSGQSFLRTQATPSEPPPALAVGPVAWARKNLFSSPGSTALTLLAVLFLAWVLPGLVKFLVTDAIFHASNAEPCRANQDGACWPFIYYKFDYFRFGAYPDPERWRVDVVELIGAVLLVWLLWRRVPRKGLAAGLFFIAFPIVAYFLLHGATWLGLPVVDTNLWGGVLITLLVSLVGIVFSLPLGVLLALGRRSSLPDRPHAVDGLHRDRARRPVHHRAVHGELHAAAVPPPGMDAGPAASPLVGTALFAAAYMAEVVRGGLQAMPKGQFEGAAAMGLGYWQTMRLIILPQALTLVIPSIVSSFISLFKDTTLVAIVGIFDLLRTIETAYNDPNWISPTTAATGFIAAAAFFWVFCFGMSRYAMAMERRLRAGRRH